jgi:predicted amidohydrolase
MAKIRIACVQMDCKLGQPELNRRRVIDWIAAASDSSAQLIIFPECALTGYCFDSLEEASQFAEPADGPSAEALSEACRKAGIYGVVGFIERSGSRLYNSAMLVGPGGLIGIYRKLHLPYLGVDRFLAPGDRGFSVFELPLGRIGILICYDISFPESARALKLLRAQIIALPTNWPTAAWRTPAFVVNARAHENHIYLAAANRIGQERKWSFIGQSKIVDPNGDLVAEATIDGQEILFADIDLDDADNNRIVNVAGAYELDRIADRRPELYRIIAGPIG